MDDRDGSRVPNKRRLSWRTSRWTPTQRDSNEVAPAQLPFSAGTKMRSAPKAANELPNYVHEGYKTLTEYVGMSVDSR